VGDGVGASVGIGVGVGAADTLGSADVEAVGSTRTDAGASVGAGGSVGWVVGVAAIAIGLSSAPTTGMAMPPRWTTNPNEIPALRIRTRMAASVARGTVGTVRIDGIGLAAIEPRR
jgi:hypothetical protein